MLDKIKLTIVYDNNCTNCNLESLWGFSCYIETPQMNILFDTGGEGETLLENLTKKKIDLNNIEKIFISHSHWDHIGGIKHLLTQKPNTDIYTTKILSEVSITNQILIKDEITQITQNIYSSGSMGNVKEQSLIIDTTSGLIIISGCGHVGIENITKKAIDKFNKNVLLVIGGFHLIKKEENHIYNIINMIENGNIQYICPLHCTGNKAKKIFKHRITDQFLDGNLGSEIIFENEVPKVVA